MTSWRVRRPFGDIALSLHPVASDAGARDASVRELRQLLHDFRGREPQVRRVLLEVDAAKNPLLKDTPGTTLGLGTPDITPIPLLRMVLGGQAWTANPGPARAVDTSAITIADLTKLAAAVDKMLGDAAGTRIPAPI